MEPVDDVAVVTATVDGEDHQLTDVVRRLGPGHGDVPGVQLGQHAVPDHLGVGGVAAQSARRQDEPPADEQCGREHRAEEA